jgi:exodeoxyribonuclease X
MAKYILFDTETTGNQVEDRIIQVGAMIVDAKGKVDVYDELCSTILPIKIEAMAIHGITPNLIEHKGIFTETNFYKTLMSLNNQDNYLIAHNMPFDMGMMKKEGFVSEIRIIDTLRVAKHLLPEQNSKALQYLRYALELYKDEQAEADKYDITIKAHDAIGDVLVMKLLLSKLVALIKEQFPDSNPMVKMEELTKTPIFIETFAFGKHKGKKISDVCDSDIGYINWMQKNMDLDVDMKYTLDSIMGHVQ